MQLILRFLGTKEGEKANDRTKNIIIKLASLVFLLGMAVGFGFMPYFINSCRKSKKFLSLSNAFSEGIFLSIGLFHILPESAKMLEEVTELPIAYICCFLSYALILFVEKVAFNSHSIVHEAHCQDEEHPHCDNDNHSIHQHHQHFGGQSKDGEDGEACINQTETKEEEKTEQVLVVKVNQNSHNHQENSSPRGLLGSTTELNQVEIKVKEKNPINKGGLSSYLLLLALGFHGLFEGISLGIQSEIKGALFLFLAIALHKWAASLTLGISFVKSGVTRKQFIIIILIFAFITPIGITLGMALTSISSNTVAGIFLSFSVGTFIYIACSEVIVDEFANPENKYWKFLCFLLGAAIVITLSLVEVFTDAGHGHAHELHEH